jgi:hypothetical protein
MRWMRIMITGQAPVMLASDISGYQDMVTYIRRHALQARCDQQLTWMERWVMGATVPQP